MSQVVEYKSIKEIPRNQILATSEDGKTVVLLDGRKFSDEIIRQAQTANKAQAAAASAAANAGKALLDDPDFTAKVHAIAVDAARQVWSEEKAKSGK